MEGQLVISLVFPFSFIGLVCNSSVLRERFREQFASVPDSVKQRSAGMRMPQAVPGAHTLFSVGVRPHRADPSCSRWGLDGAIYTCFCPLYSGGFQILSFVFYTNSKAAYPLPSFLLCC